MDAEAERGIGSGVWIILGLYVGVIILISLLSLLRKRKRMAESTGEAPSHLTEHYIASGTLGNFVLPLTLFSSFFSSVIIVGLPAEAADYGYYGLRWIPSTLFCVYGQSMLGARLRRWSEYRGGYVSGVDVLSDRWRDSELRVLGAIVQIIAAFLGLVTEFIAIGATLFALSGGAIPHYASAIVTATIMLVYESIGGMQAVAWTDAVQGLMMFLGFTFILAAVGPVFGGLPNAVDFLVEQQPELIAVPTTLQSLAEIVPFYFLFFPWILYGHIQQRVFAAKSESHLRNANAFLLVGNVYVSTGAVVIGITAKAFFYDELASENSDDVFGLVLRGLLLFSDASFSITYLMGSLILAAMVAALMSTADSYLLSLSCTSTVDLVQPFLRKDATSSELVWIGRGMSLVAVVASVAVSLVSTGVISVLVLQQHFINQLFPPFIAALYMPRAKSRPITIGCLVGLISTLIIYFTVEDPLIIANISFFTMALNALVAYGLHWIDSPYLEPGYAGDESIWARFGEPLPEHMTSYSAPGLAREIIHPPFAYGLIAIFVIGFVFGVPWISPGAIGTITNGLPTWATVNLTIWIVFSIILAWGLIKYWEDNEELNPSKVKAVADDSEELSDASLKAGDDESVASDVLESNAGDVKLDKMSDNLEEDSVTVTGS